MRFDQNKCNSTLPLLNTKPFMRDRSMGHSCDFPPLVPEVKKQTRLYTYKYLFFHARLLAQTRFFQMQYFSDTMYLFRAVRLKTYMITIAHAHIVHTFIIQRFLSTTILNVTFRFQNDSSPLVSSIFSFVFLPLRVSVRRKSFSTSSSCQLFRNHSRL